MITEALLTKINEGRTGNNIGFSIGLDKLETVIDGLCQSTYTLIFSNSGSGKTTLALYSYIYKPIMQHLDDDNFKVLYISLEMGADVLMAKLLCMYLFETYGMEISVKELFSRREILSDEVYTLVNDSENWLKQVESKLIIYDKIANADTIYKLVMNEVDKNGSITETETRKVYSLNNPRLIFEVVIDHLSLIRPSKGRSLKEEMDLTSSYLVTLRNIYGISPLVIMQANRDSMGMERRKQGLSNMRLSDTKDSGNPPQDAEVVLSIFNPNREKLSTYKGYDIAQLGDKFRCITVLKSRYGESDVEVGCNFFGRMGIWKELPKPLEIIDYQKYLDASYILNENSLTV